MDENRFWILASKKIACEISAEETVELELLYLHHPDYKDIIENLQVRKDPNIYPSAKSEEKILKNLRSKIAQLHPVSEEVEMTEEPIPHEENPSFWLTYRRNILIGCVAIMISAGLLFIYTKQTAVPAAIHFTDNNVATKPGSRSQIKLPDGTLVTLNADSKISYPDNFIGSTREVVLEGEAFFEVTENKARPFIIHLKTMDIKVLGTVFNVKSYPAEHTSEASLIKGSIEVTLKNRRNEKIMLKPNEKISVSDEIIEETKSSVNNAANSRIQRSDNIPLISLSPLDVDKKENIVKEIGWTQNKLMFKNQSLEDIAIILYRWYGRNIEIRSDKLKEQKFTGNFNNESLMQVLQALQVSYNFNFKRENNSITIY